MCVLWQNQTFRFLFSNKIPSQGSLISETASPGLLSLSHSLQKNTDFFFFFLTKILQVGNQTEPHLIRSAPCHPEAKTGRQLHYRTRPLWFTDEEEATGSRGRPCPAPLAPGPAQPCTWTPLPLRDAVTSRYGGDRPQRRARTSLMPATPPLGCGPGPPPAPGGLCGGLRPYRTHRGNGGGLCGVCPPLQSRLTVCCTARKVASSNISFQGSDTVPGSGR